MLHRTAVIDLVALTDRQLSQMPRLSALMQIGSRSCLKPTLPAVTCTSQSAMLTGASPSTHGIVGNGWHDRDRAETRFWQQSNGLVGGKKIWDRLARHDETFTCANCFWWYAMYADVDVTVTPRPMYPADGRKIPDIWTRPAALRDSLQRDLGQFPLFKFWGPGADISSTAWIAAAARRVDAEYDPTLLLTYLPHLDYGLQKFGPDSPHMAQQCALLDDVASDLIEHLMSRGRRILVVNEYGIMPVTRSCAPNIALRAAGLLAMRDERGRLHLDAGESRAFAVTDHQVAHVYVADHQDIDAVVSCLQPLDGVDQVLRGDDLVVHGLSHERCGDCVLVAKADCWFRHDWWTCPQEAPDYQRTVDIHRKPGYDPRELFIDPAIGVPKLAIALRLLRKTLGFRTLMDVIPLDPTLVRGSHGRCDAADEPIVWSSEPMDFPDHIPMPDVSDIIAALSGV